MMDKRTYDVLDFYARYKELESIDADVNLYPNSWNYCRDVGYIKQTETGYELSFSGLFQWYLNRKQHANRR